MVCSAPTAEATLATNTAVGGGDRQQRTHGGAAAVGGEVGVDDEAGVDVESGRGHRGRVAGTSAAGGVGGLGAREERDPAVAERDEVLDRECDAVARAAEKPGTRGESALELRLLPSSSFAASVPGRRQREIVRLAVGSPTIGLILGPL
jgi:hypothetical protein